MRLFGDLRSLIIPSRFFAPQITPRVAPGFGRLGRFRCGKNCPNALIRLSVGVLSGVAWLRGGIGWLFSGQEVGRMMLMSSKGCSLSTILTVKPSPSDQYQSHHHDSHHPSSSPLPIRAHPLALRRTTPTLQPPNLRPFSLPRSPRTEGTPSFRDCPHPRRRRRQTWRIRRHCAIHPHKIRQWPPTIRLER